MRAIRTIVFGLFLLTKNIYNLLNTKNKDLQSNN